MSERGFRMAAMGAVAALALQASPALAQECAQILPSFQFCGHDTPLAAAELSQFDEGATLRMPGYLAEATEALVADLEGDGLEDRLGSLLRLMGVDGDMPRGGFETADLSVAHAMLRQEMGGGLSSATAIMLIEGGTGRMALILTLTNADATSIDRAARDLVSLLRPGQKG